MKLPARNTLTLHDRLKGIMQAGWSLKGYVDQLKNLASSGNATAIGVRNALNQWKLSRQSLLDCVPTPGLQDYAKQQLEDNSFDVTEAHTAILAEVELLMAWAEKFLGDAGLAKDQQFTPEETEAMRVNLDKVSATVEA